MVSPWTMMISAPSFRARRATSAMRRGGTLVISIPTRVVSSVPSQAVASWCSRLRIGSGSSRATWSVMASARWPSASEATHMSVAETEPSVRYVWAWKSYRGRPLAAAFEGMPLRGELTDVMFAPELGRKAPRERDGASG